MQSYRTQSTEALETDRKKQIERQADRQTDRQTDRQICYYTKLLKWQIGTKKPSKQT